MEELPRIASSLFSGRSPRTRSERFFVFEAVSSLLPDFSSGGKTSLLSCGDAVFAFSAAFSLSADFKASLFSCVVETFSLSADSEAPSGFSDWREAFSLSVCIGLFPDRPLFGRDAQDTDTKKIDRQAIAERETCIGFHTKVRFIDFFTEQPPIYPKRFYRSRGADLPSLCPQAV